MPKFGEFHTLSYFFHFGEPIGAQNLLKISILKNLLKIKWCTWRLTIIIFPPLRRDFRGRLHAGVICKLQLNRISIYKEIEDPNPSEDRYVIQFLSLRPFKRFNATNHGGKISLQFPKKEAQTNIKITWSPNITQYPLFYNAFLLHPSQ